MNNNTQYNNPPSGARGSRESILAAIKNNKPMLVDLPVVDINAVIQYPDIIENLKLH